ncbi:MAG TPA: DNA polymerase III subunit gamma/tau [Candidatus Omnitrophica bacterium]|nr:MAG: DNA polymerase III, subunit gamma and tau [Omnitrophica WOR_2 bacterium GWA2_53_43]HBO97480.1 DNA polymerase III subunit gamma/tau [Candidatus Omnitrophota bacterium]HCI44425.1 DNA polymerase III subunit gamma/tau [Candidatus Omnitrophota bacterium]
MSYLVLARKHRPQTFDEVTGQEHITDLLKKAIQSSRIHHAYLFCGPRGIGKTSCARILAKSLNCEKGPTFKPCGECVACQEITRGSSMDVLEIDGASNRGIDEIRTLRENVKFAPSSGKYKIYIVDEVHMLTAEAFNALLKTLEEPPAHVKFIFATTAPQKVPATIISRCQRFDFKRIPVETIVATMARISKKEKLKIDQDALYTIAKAAQGSLRDALSILDQLSALSDEGIKSADVFSMLGMVETQFLFDLTGALARKNCSLALEVLERIIDQGKDIKQLNKDLIEHFRNLMVIKIGGKALGKLIDYPAAVKDMYLDQCAQFTLKDILKAIDILIETQDIAGITESARMPLEVAFAKLTYTGEAFLAPPVAAASAPARQVGPPPAPEKQPEVKPVSGSGFPPANVLRSEKGQLDLSAACLPDLPAGRQDRQGQEGLTPAVKKTGDDDEDIPEVIDEISEGGPLPPAAPETLDLAKIKRCWDTLTFAVSRERMSLATYLQEGTPLEFRDGRLTIGFPPKCAFQKGALEDQNTKQLVAKIFSAKLEAPVSLHYELIGDFKPQEEESAVKDVLNTFQGKVVSRWHKE